jgi:ABC-2 type transport system permease protein
MTDSAGVTRTTIDEDALRSVLSYGERPKRPNALSASLTFGWRALLKIKHVPEQLFDAVGNPIIFTLLFTYLLGGAIAGSTGAYLRVVGEHACHVPPHLRQQYLRRPEDDARLT